MTKTRLVFLEVKMDVCCYSCHLGFLCNTSFMALQPQPQPNLMGEQRPTTNPEQKAIKQTTNVNC